VTLTIADVSGEGILLAGGAAAILLQVADPAVARVVARHSDFAERPLDRLHGTLTYLYVTVYGTPDEARAIARHVGGAHAQAPGSTNAHLQLWVAATLYDTAMRIRRLIHGEDSPEDADALLADYAVIGTALGVPRALWPATRPAFERYWSDYPLAVGDEARSIATQLLYARKLPWWMRALLPTLRTVTAGLLEAPLRDAYGFKFDERRFARLVRVARTVYPRLPRRLREWPKDHYLRRFRQATRSRG
jgi:uncharacterized protein (DUF2236 family)